MGHSQTQQCVGERLDRETKKASEKKNKARSENTGHSQTQQCIGERLDKETKKAGEKTSKKQEYGSLTVIVGKKLGWIVAQKRHTLTAVHWQEVGMERGTKKVQDSEKSERRKYVALTNTAMCW